MIENIKIKNFTAFDELETGFCPGVNILVGANGTGKTHLLKILYALSQPKWEEGMFSSSTELKLLRLFRPSGSFNRLLKKGKSESFVSISVENAERTIEMMDKKNTGKISVQKKGDLLPGTVLKPVYFPVKEMLANAPGFRSLYTERETHFEEVYADIIDKAFLPPLKTVDPRLEASSVRLRKATGGKVITKNEVFYLKTGRGEFEFTLVAEGMRKLALLWLLIRNGSLGENTILFWDEPETNINPSMIPLVVDVLFELERIGAQIFIATHSYVVCKEFDLQRKAHSLRYYSLFQTETDGIGLSTSSTYHNLKPNQISEQYGRMYDREIERALGGANG